MTKDCFDSKHYHNDKQVHSYTIDDATKAYPLIDFKAYITNVLHFASSDVSGVVLNSPDYKFNLNEPDQLKSLSNYLNSTVAPRTIYNYFFFRLFRQYSNFMEQNHVTEADRWMRKSQQRTRAPVHALIYHPSELDDDDQLISQFCNTENMNYLGYVNTRMLIEERFSSSNDRNKIQEHVALIIEKVLDGFQTQIDELSWMTDYSKRGAYNKIKYLVRNVAYPNMITDNKWLDDYYANLNVDLNSGYIDVLQKLFQFSKYKSFERLKTTSGVVRDDFGQSPSAVNAWYQPSLNSITFPIGILQRPFYDLNYPASINFGAIGMVGGHELGHGFDNQGSQYNGAGILAGWMDEDTQTNFDEMASCVKAQYSQFSPVQNFTIDGTQTLGENMADSAGIRAAYNAFKAHENFYGSEPRLPDQKLDAFTHEQLFFLSFARIWCEQKPDANSIIQQVLTDVQLTPPISSTLQTNFVFWAQFKTSQPFEVHSIVAKALSTLPIDVRRCPVWASEVGTVTGVPDTDDMGSESKVNNVNPPKESNNDQYKAVASRLNKAMNIKASPCDNFVDYACGNFQSNETSPYAKAHTTVRKAVFDFASKPVAKDDPNYTILAKKYIDACKKYDTKSVQYATSLVKVTEMSLDQEFPLFATKKRLKPLDPQRLGETLGLLSTVYHSDVLFKTSVKPLQPRLVVEKPYAIYFDQAHLTFDREWYVGAKSNETKTMLKDYVKSIFVRYRNALGKKIPDSQFDGVAEESSKTNTLEKSDYQRVKLDAFDADNDQIDFSVYLDTIFKITNVTKPYNTMSEGYAILDSTAFFKGLNTEVRGVGDGNNLRIFYNFFFYRLLHLNSALLPGESNVGLSQSDECTEALSYQLAPAYSRIAVNQLYSSPDKFQTVQKEFAEIADYIQRGFTIMLDSLSWFSTPSIRKQAHKKVDAIVRNFGVPDFVLTDEIKNYYTGFMFTDETNFASCVLDLKLFSKTKEFKKLNDDGDISRTEYRSNEYMEPIWSDYDLNSISFTLDIMQEPMYSKDYPSHEIGHAFDQNGILFDAYGQLNNWSTPIKDKFNNMTDCVNKQYKDYACTKTTQTDRTDCIDLESTINDNLADNIGLQAAIRGFRSWISFKGQDPRLPDAVLDRFTNEQLFFLSYAQQFCPKTNYTLYNFGSRQSPNEFRLQGSLSNSLVFRSAFNCPNGKNYSPANVCPIWSDIDVPELHVPKVETDLPSLNIPQNPESKEAGFKACAKVIEDTIDTHVDPCNNFYSYVCKRHQGMSVLVDMELKNEATMIKVLKNVKATDIEPAKKEQAVFQNCLNNADKIKDLNKGAELPRKIIEAVQLNAGVNFPLANNNSDNLDALPVNVSRAIGFISRRLKTLRPLINNVVQPDYFHPELGYLLYLISPSLINPASTYNGNKGEEQRDNLTKLVRANLEKYFNAIGITVDPKLIISEPINIARIDYELAQNLDPDPIDSSGDTLKDRIAVYNIYTVQNSSTAFPGLIDIPSFLDGISDGIPELQARVKDPSFRFLVSAPTNLVKVSNKLANLKKFYSIEPKTLWNYIFYRIIHELIDFLPSNSFDINVLVPKDGLRGSSNSYNVPGVRPPIPELPSDHPVFASYEFTQNERVCYLMTKATFIEVNNKLFVFALYPDKKQRDTIRADVATFADSAITSMRAMIDQVWWLNSQSKKNLNRKLDLVAPNILYANDTLVDDYLTKYYKDLDVTSTNFFDLRIAAWTFERRRDLVSLAITTGLDRDNFLDTTQANAFYRPNYNSITILTGITQPPVYDITWPKSFIYGAMGLVIGHEINHGYDPSGIQWNGLGKFGNIIEDDLVAVDRYNNITQCLIDEYAKFCDESGTQCIGKQTIGENTADNGGIQTAYRSYRSHMDYYGEDPALPGKIASQFSNDQLFFIGFARTWCNPDDKPLSSYNWTDAHSPDPYRIIGALRNFDAFRAAFNCPVDSNYAPKQNDTCKVWITDVTPHLNVPTVPTDEKQNINLPTPVVIPKENTSYKAVADYFSKSIDVYQKPCDNFYEYTCNNLVGSLGNSRQVDHDVADLMYQELDAIVYATSSYKPLKNYYDGCLLTMNAVPDATTVNALIADLKATGGVAFPLFEGGTVTFTAQTLGTAIGYLSAIQDINTIVSVRVLKRLGAVDTDPTKKYILSIDEPTLTHPVSFYQNTMKSQIVNVFVDFLTVYQNNITTPNTVTDAAIKDAAESFFKIESTIAQKMRTFNDRNDPTKIETATTIGNLKTNHAGIGWTEFFVQLKKMATTVTYDDAHAVSVPNPDKLNDVLSVLTDPANGISGNNFADYLNFRVLWELKTSLFKVSFNGSAGFPAKDQSTMNKYICALETRALPMLHSRVLMQLNCKPSRNEVAKVGNRVIGSLKNQIQQTTWLSAAIKPNILAKFDSLTLNTLLDNRTLVDRDLATEYQTYVVSATPTALSALTAFRNFNVQKRLALAEAATLNTRNNFIGSSSDAKPTYDVLTNSLSVPLSLAQSPYFGTDHPLATNYGGLGYLIAHALTHSFDKFGIQFNDTGSLQVLLDPSAQTQFDAIATCLINQYNKTCPLAPGDYQPNCLDGARTLNENIADNAGIHAAYNAYLSASNFRGEDPRLFSPVLSQFSERQLFFLSYVRNLCVPPQSKAEIFTEIIAGRNPPSLRVQNALQNFPAFHSAFSCAANSKYVRAEADICNVWTSDIDNQGHQQST
ncbi:hypothetical protein M3Y97_01008200 [Aphelenchoides bicaudatus]|nr:hypothetical protein M3Y97_01008200 [Aphelenchoides bicaudatus]